MSDKETQEREAAEKAAREILAKEKEEEKRRTEMENDKKEIEAKVRETARKEEQNRIREIHEMGERHDMAEQAREAIQQDMSVDGFRKLVLDELGKRTKDAMAAPHVEISAKEQRSYSVCRALLSCIDGNVDAGLEREISTEIERRTGKPAAGIYIPYTIATRDFSVSGTGSNVVDTDLKTGQFIDLLRNRLVTRQLGMTMLTGLEGDVAIPKHTAGTTAYWIDTEGNDITAESEPTLGQIAATVHELGGYTELTRKLLKQSSIDVENLVRGDLAATLATEIDRAALFGTNASGQPKGLLNTSGVNDITCTAAAPTWKQILNFEAEIEADNADIGSFGWATTPAIKAILKSTEKASNTAQFLWDSSNEVNGYPAMVSNQIEDNYIIFGVWSQLVLAMWGGLDVNIDDKSLSKSGGLRIVALQDVDVMVRHPQAFAYTDDVTGS